MTATLNLDPIKALCAAATPGPWGRDMAQDGEHRPDGTGYAGDWYETNTICEAPSEDNEGECEHIADAYRSENAAFIARSRSIVDALVAEVERLRAEVAEAEQARGLIERVVGCKGGPPTLLNLSTVVEVLAERYAEVGGDALWGRLSHNRNDPVDLRFLREAVYAVWTGEPMADETNDGLTGAFVEIERLRVEVAERAVEMDHLRAEVAEAIADAERTEQKPVADRWAIYDPIEERYDFHGTEGSALSALDSIVDALRDRSSREVEGWDDNADQAAVYALVRVAGLELRTVATAGDGTEEGETCQRNGWSHLAEAEIVRVGSDGDGEEWARP